MNTKSKTLKTILITFLTTVILIAVILVVLLFKLDFPYKKFFRVLSIIESTYVEEYDKELAEEYAIDALVYSLGDEYSVYYNEENIESLMTILEGNYVGIGAEVFANADKKRIEIISVIADSPAERAGLKSGDLFKSIDDKEYSDQDLTDAVTYLKGVGIEKPLEKDVKITLCRGEEEYSVVLKREEINMYKVKPQVIDDICYIKYSGFTETSYKQFNDIVKNLDSSVKGVVVDLRGNPGGELDSAINTCGIFLDEKVIMYTIDKNGGKTVYKTNKGSVDIPMAVLIDSSTASAAEVFAGAMKAHKRGVIIGEKSYGKGVTQSVIALNPFDVSKGAVKITAFKNYTPDGIWINEGIKPDIEVPSQDKDVDIKQDKAFIEAVNSLKKDN